MNKENLDQQLLSFEDCRRKILELGKFEFRDNRYISHSKGMIKLFRKNKLLKNSCTFHVKNLPIDIADQEIVYHILWSKTEYIDPKCPFCGKIVKFRRINVGYAKYCSEKCRSNDPNYQELKSKLYFEKTGYYYPSQNPKAMEKRKETSLSKYGTEWPLSNKEVQEKRRNTHFEKTGYYEPLANPKLREKYRQDRLERTGYDHNMRDPESYEYWRNCYREKTGYDHMMHNPEVKEKVKNTNIEKYGVPRVFCLKEVRDEIKNERFERTGYYYPLQNPEMVLKVQKDYFDKTGFHSISENPETIRKSQLTKLERYGDPGYHNVEKMKATCLERFGYLSNLCMFQLYSKVSQNLFWEIYNRLSEELKSECYFGSLNKEFGKFDKENNCGYFYDFTLSHSKIVIEFDGDYWHSKEGAKEKDEQKQKFIENEGFTMLRIKESDYYNDKEGTVNICLDFIDSHKLINIL